MVIHFFHSLFRHGKSSKLTLELYHIVWHVLSDKSEKWKIIEMNFLCYKIELTSHDFPQLMRGPFEPKRNLFNWAKQFALHYPNWKHLLCELGACTCTSTISFLYSFSEWLIILSFSIQFHCNESTHYQITKKKNQNHFKLENSTWHSSTHSMIIIWWQQKNHI